MAVKKMLQVYLRLSTFIFIVWNEKTISLRTEIMRAQLSLMQPPFLASLICTDMQVVTLKCLKRAIYYKKVQVLIVPWFLFSESNLKVKIVDTCQNNVQIFNFLLMLIERINEQKTQNNEKNTPHLEKNAICQNKWELKQ